jgi:hypothetical protein
MGNSICCSSLARAFAISVFNAIALKAGVRQDQQELAVDPNGVNMLVGLLAALDIVWREPAATPFAWRSA